MHMCKGKVYPDANIIEGFVCAGVSGQGSPGLRCQLRGAFAAGRQVEGKRRRQAGAMSARCARHVFDTYIHVHIYTYIHTNRQTEKQTHAYMKLCIYLHIFHKPT